MLINKAMVEIPPKFADRPPVNPETRNEPTVVARTWTGAQGLADDVRHYGRWMRDEAEKRIGHLYPPVEITPEIVRERPDLKPYRGRELPPALRLLQTGNIAPVDLAQAAIGPGMAVYTRYGQSWPMAWGSSAERTAA